MIKSIIIATILLTTASLAQAHPVSFKGGWGLMSYNNSDMTELLMTYSFNSRLAIAGTYLRTDESNFYIPRINFLVKRWNGEDYQSNFYLSAGKGVEVFNMKSYNSNLGEVVFDWESRKYYTSFQHLYINRDNQVNPLIKGDYNYTKVRAGFAPFLADYEDLNIWLIAQEEIKEGENLQFSQFIRFYKKNVLWEIGAGMDGSFSFNFMVHL